MRLISKPILCNYYLTYRCNAKCGFCDIWEKPSPFITLEDVERNLLDLKKLGVKVIDFTGGEPLLHPKLDQILHFAKSLGFITTVTTNCIRYPKYALRLKGLIDMLHFSLDAPTKEAHDASRGVRCFDAFLASIELAKQIGEKPDILFTVHNQNIDDIQEVYEKFCLPNQLVLILNPIFDYNQVDTNGGLTAESLKKLAFWGKKKYVYLNKAFLALRKDGGNQINRPVCKAASSTLVISPDNQLVLPCYHLGMKTFPIEGKLFELYKSSVVDAIIKQEGRLPACQGCVINCYMQPSFAVKLNKYFFLALPSTFKYNWLKGTWKQLFRKKKLPARIIEKDEVLHK